MPSEIQNVVWP